MPTFPPSIIEYRGKASDDPDYDTLLAELAKDHPLQLEQWREIERTLFENRRGFRAYPDRDLMKFCQDYLLRRLVDNRGLGAFHAWQVLRGRILRSLLEARPELHPAPGKVLITDPQVCTDRELVAMLDDFKCKHPRLWNRWEVIEANFGAFGDDPLREISCAFHRHIREHCWVGSPDAASMTFSYIRTTYFGPREERSE